MRWLLLDEVLSIKKNSKVCALARVPAQTVSAEPLLMEMMAQTGGLLLGAESDFQEDIIFAKIETADFFDPYPGEELRIEASSGGLRPEGSWIDAVIETRDGKKVAQSRFLLVGVGRLDPAVQRPIVFHEAFMKHFRIREKIKERAAR